MYPNNSPSASGVPVPFHVTLLPVRTSPSKLLSEDVVDSAPAESMCAPEFTQVIELLRNVKVVGVDQFIVTPVHAGSLLT